MFRKTKKYLFASAMVLCVAFVAQAKIKPSGVFGDNMVLQRDMEVPIWGDAEKGEKISVTLNTVKIKTVADENGRWKVKLPKQQAGGAYTLTISGDADTVTFTNLAFGEVWFASGQSNMMYKMERGVPNGEVEIRGANYPDIRLFNHPRSLGQHPVQTTAGGSWEVCTSESVKSFSAVAYFFAKELHKKYNVPVGIILSGWGGTQAEAFCSYDVLKSIGEYKEQASKLESGEIVWSTSDRPASIIGAMFGGMISPFIGYGIKGVIWYQGEANSRIPQLYAEVFSKMIKDWRLKWGQGDFPFLYVQLPNYIDQRTKKGIFSSWPLVREAQLQTLELPNTGMAITVDVGDPHDLHPKDKYPVGLRLSKLAQKIAYEGNIVHTGPLLKKVKIKNDKGYLFFDHVGKGLVMENGNSFGSLEVAGEDRAFYTAQIEIAGDKIIVSSEQVEKIVAVRYNWRDNPMEHIYNSEHLPASPFRTDNWAETIVKNN